MVQSQVDPPPSGEAQPISLDPRRRLSSKLLILTILFVMLAEVLIFVPSVANFRLRWLEQRLDTAAVASILITDDEARQLTPPVRDDVLMATGAKAIAMRKDGVSRLLVVSEMPPGVDGRLDLTEVSPLEAIGGAFDTLAFGGGRTISVVGSIGDSADTIEMIIDETGLRTAMWIYARNVALISLVISLITALLVFVAINRMMIRPIRTLTRSMLDFAHQPESGSAVIRPSGRNDELGIAEEQLAQMQSELQSMLKGRKRLADLGLAVSKINHDMRNILASAQLMSDRLADVNEPAVQRFAPKLVRSIDRAVSYTSEVLSYGRASELAPTRRRVRLSTIVDDVEDLLGLEPGGDISFSTGIDPDLEIDADPEQLFRVLMNLCRNAVQAMRDDAAPATVKRLSISAARMGTMVLVSVEDTGPGLPARARENLFSPFKGSVRHGGTGLGLAIARELVEAHGGTLELRDDRQVGTGFEIRLPDAPVELDTVRAARSA